MRRLALAVLALAMGAGAARADGVVASWVQLGPGSSAAVLRTGAYGDVPLSRAPTILLRTIISGGACPVAMLDDATELKLAPRFNTADLTRTPGTLGATNTKTQQDGTTYPQYFIDPGATADSIFPDGQKRVTTAWSECEAVVPAGHTTATLGSTVLKLPAANPKRVLVLADTGCRMSGDRSKDGSNQQNCHDPAAFPLKFLAAFEATMHPDLIIHVGDYFYRDTDCLTHGAETFPGCNTPTSPDYEIWGDTFDSWNADFILPAQPLLAAAPWVMVRGNHESCGRGARGWYALLDPHPFSVANVTCPANAGATPVPEGADTPVHSTDFQPTYTVTAGPVTFIVLDSSFAPDPSIDANMARNYDIDLSAAVRFLGPDAAAVFTTHKPSFGLGSYSITNFGNLTEQSMVSGRSGYTNTVFKDGVPASIGLFLSGHIHQFEYIVFAQSAARYAPQLIVGNGGSLLDDDIGTGTVPLGNADLGAFQAQDYRFKVNQAAGASTTEQIRRAFAHDEFGFAVLDLVQGDGGAVGYDANVFTIDATQLGVCRITLRPARNIECSL
jgi:Calcineurin-like phosphoesterase